MSEKIVTGTLYGFTKGSLLVSGQPLSDWTNSDVRVSYDRDTERVLFTAVSTGEVVHSFGLYDDLYDGIQTGDCITPTGIVRPLIDLTPAPLWRRILNRIIFWLRTFRDAT